MKHFKSVVSTGQAGGRETVSRSEANALNGRRAKPAPALELNLGGSAGQSVRKLEDLRLARRSGYIESRLALQGGRATSDFTRAQVRGVASHDFERSR